MGRPKPYKSLPIPQITEKTLTHRVKYGRQGKFTTREQSQKKTGTDRSVPGGSDIQFRGVYPLCGFSAADRFLPDDGIDPAQ